MCDIVHNMWHNMCKSVAPYLDTYIYIYIFPLSWVVFSGHLRLSFFSVKFASVIDAQNAAAHIAASYTGPYSP